MNLYEISNSINTSLETNYTSKELYRNGLLKEYINTFDINISRDDFFPLCNNIELIKLHWDSIDTKGNRYSSKDLLRRLDLEMDYPLSDYVLDELWNYWNYGAICKFQSLNYFIIASHINDLDWEYISKYQNLSQEFIIKYSDKVDWSLVAEFQDNLTFDFVNTYMPYHCMKYMKKISCQMKLIEKLKNIILSSKDIVYNINEEDTITSGFEELINESLKYDFYFNNNELVDIIENNYNILKNNNLFSRYKYNLSLLHGYSDDFIENHLDDIFMNWKDIIMYQDLSELFIERYKDTLPWNYICRYQIMSNEFIKSHYKYIWWDCLEKNIRLKSQIQSDQELYKRVNLKSRIESLWKYNKITVWDAHVLNTYIIIKTISENKNLDKDEIIFEYKDILDWRIILEDFKVSEELIIRCRDIIFWNESILEILIKNQRLSNEFINNYFSGQYMFSKRIWSLICKYQKLSEYFMITNEKLLDWNNIKQYQTYGNAFESIYEDML